MDDSGRQTDKIINAANLIEDHQKQLVADNKQVLADNRTSLTDSLRENRNELAAALRQNRAALESSKQQSVASSNLDQRPWLQIQPLVVNTSWQIGSPIAANVNVINTGKTPAINVIGDIVVDPIPTGGTLKFIYLSDRMHLHMKTNAFLPGFPVGFNAGAKVMGTSGSPIDSLVTTENRVKIIDGTIFIVVYGKITYDDVFGAHHWITFCGHSQYTVISVDSTRDISESCADYNDVDRKNNPNPPN
jgi:hypothetical protein